MPRREKQLLDIYTDYLLSSFSATTATCLSRLVPQLSHDQVTRFLSSATLGKKELWLLVKPQVRAVQSETAVLILDDTVQEKPYSDESELVTWHYDHTQGESKQSLLRFDCGLLQNRGVSHSNSPQPMRAQGHTLHYAILSAWKQLQSIKKALQCSTA